MFLALLCVTTCVHVIYVAVILCCRILLFRVNYWDKRSSCNRTFPQILNTLVWQPKFTVRNKYNIALRLHLFSGFLLLATMLLLTINVTLCTYNNEQCFFILMLFLHILLLGNVCHANFVSTQLPLVASANIITQLCHIRNSILVLTDRGE